ncbi:hypothetical protein PLICRDRAFT_42816 [Plicaturopsis crispa FD-325 SS-3]|nr:hypothetical protein PLICRDRAFT_42816 [Plicaturopsis crispa FD-325 SS-3]
MLGSPDSYTSSLMLDDVHTKVHHGHLYLRQQRTVEIIQLVEVSPPPPRRITSVIASSSAGPSSYTSSSSYDSEAYTSEEESTPDDCSSYCSSDAPAASSRSGSRSAIKPDDTHIMRMNRIHAWRELYARIPEENRATSPPLKRKTADEEIVPQSPKRSRRHHTHACVACDALFMNPDGLRRHGHDAAATEACRIAAEYDLE